MLVKFLLEIWIVLNWTIWFTNAGLFCTYVFWTITESIFQKKICSIASKLGVDIVKTKQKNSVVFLVVWRIIVLKRTTIIYVLGSLIFDSGAFSMFTQTLTFSAHAPWLNVDRQKKIKWSNLKMIIVNYWPVTDHLILLDVSIQQLTYFLNFYFRWRKKIFWQGRPKKWLLDIVPKKMRRKINTFSQRLPPAQHNDLFSIKILQYHKYLLILNGLKQILLKTSQDSTSNWFLHPVVTGI